MRHPTAPPSLPHHTSTPVFAHVAPQKVVRVLCTCLLLMPLACVCTFVLLLMDFHAELLPQARVVNGVLLFPHSCVFAALSPVLLFLAWVQVILGLPYGTKIDLWSLGCIMAELWTGRVLFQNDSVQTMLARMIGVIGACAWPPCTHYL
jgi:hypothetical protein